MPQVYYGLTQPVFSTTKNRNLILIFNILLNVKGMLNSLKSEIWYSKHGAKQRTATQPKNTKWKLF